MSKKDKLIERRAGAAGYVRPVIKGTRTRVSAIAQLYEQMERESPAQRIQRALPYLEIEQIEAAIEYWRGHPEEIEADIERDNAAYQELTSHR
jgi:uncharacterized protein (DUF433 family)